MRDYDNMPELNWSGKQSANQARAQILHEEPIILKMPENFISDISSEDFGCKLDEQSGIFYDCEGGDAIRHLAELNKLPELDEIASACADSSSQVDVDPAGHRLIIHD